MFYGYKYSYLKIGLSPYLSSGDRAYRAEYCGKKEVMRILWLRNTVELNQFTGGKQMKKLTVIALAVAAIMLFAIPAMALDADFGGAYEVNGFYMDNSDLDDNTGATSAFMDMRLRLGTDFKITDSLTLTTRLDALDNKVWGRANYGAAGAGSNAGSNISIDRCYLTAKTGLGEFIIGRFITGDFGTLFLDSGIENEGDQIEWHLPKSMEGLDTYVFYEKVVEGDQGNVNADADIDDYGIGMVYKAEGVDAGIEITYTDDQNTNAQQDIQTYLWNPYVVAKLGPVNLAAELGYMHGTLDTVAAGAKDQDYKMLAYNAALSTDVGPANVGAGYAFSSGDNDGAGTGDIEAMGYAEDWQPLLILTGYTNDTTLGQATNLNAENTSVTVQQLGFKVIYVTASFAPTEDISVNFIGAQAKADETGVLGANVDDDVGYEYDLGVKVKLMDNLSYNATIGYLDAGDMWKSVGTGEADSTYTFLHSLVVSF